MGWQLVTIYGILRYHVLLKAMLPANMFRFILFVIVCFSAFSEPVEVSLASNLGKNAAFQMAQDSNGYLWIGTQQGLYRSNNRIFEAFTEVDHPEF